MLNRRHRILGWHPYISFPKFHVETNDGLALMKGTKRLFRISKPLKSVLLMITIRIGRHADR
jgi:hypothetical protein